MCKNEIADTLKTRSRSWMVPVAGLSSLILVAGIAVLLAVPVQAKFGSTLPQSSFKANVPSVVKSPTPQTLAAEKPENDVHASLKNKLRGQATWYGGVLNGRPTANGERFDMYAMTACHPTLPFGSLVRVYDKKTRRTVVVRINDRGMLGEGRIIDLSYGAAAKLGIVKSGVASVVLHVVHVGDGHVYSARELRVPSPRHEQAHVEIASR